MKTRKLIVVAFQMVCTFSLDSCETPKPISISTPAGCGTVTDIDGNVYQTVTIGTQCWMMENLKVTKYRNGDPIPNITDSISWTGLTTGGYCNYNNKAINAITYGSLYNWYAVNDSRNIAPVGWHIPTDVEWQTLIDYLGGMYDAGKKMRAPSGWALVVNTNTSGFDALPSGSRDCNGPFGTAFKFVGISAIWWSSIKVYTIYAMSCELNCFSDGVYMGSDNLSDGLSVRCIKD